jgi:hypothetical protein
MPKNPSFPPVFDTAFLHDQWEDDREDGDREPRETRYSIVVDMYHWCRPVFNEDEYLRNGHQMNHSAIGDKLREVGVTIESECSEDHESGGFYIYFSAKKKARAWVGRLNTWLAEQCQSKIDPTERLLGYNRLQYSLADQAGDYVVMGRADLTRIMEAAESLDEKHGLGFAAKLKGLEIMVEDYRDIHP